jgi:hypothetical protein
MTVLIGCTSTGPAGTSDALQTAPSSTAPVDPSPPASSPVASATVLASTPPDASPADVTRLGPDAIGVVVATDGLRVRSLPTVGPASKRFEPLLPEGTRLYVVDGPVSADGYTWYRVQPYSGTEAFPFGWVAAGSRDGEPWIDPVPLRCDSIAPTAEALVTGEPLEHLYCSLAGEMPRTSPPGPDIAIEGNVYCTVADDHWGALSGPDWIDQLGYCALQTDQGSIRLPGAPMSRLLGGESNPVEGRYALVGHFDDRAARQCREGSFDGGHEPDPAQTVLHCRTFFIVTRATPLS